MRRAGETPDDAEIGRMDHQQVQAEIQRCTAAAADAPTPAAGAAPVDREAILRQQRASRIEWDARTKAKRLEREAEDEEQRAAELERSLLMRNDKGKLYCNKCGQRYLMHGRYCGVCGEESCIMEDLPERVLYVNAEPPPGPPAERPGGAAAADFTYPAPTPTVLTGGAGDFEADEADEENSTGDWA